MGRLVEPPRRLHTSNQESIGGDGGATEGGDGFLERVVKYVPAEILAAYVTLDNIVASDARNLGKGQNERPVELLTRRDMFDFYLPEIVFAGMLIMVFVYFRMLGKWSSSPGAKQVWFGQALISAIVFVVWCYAMGGNAFEMNGWFVEKYAAMMVPVFTLLSGLYRPSPTSETAALQVTRAQMAQPASLRSAETTSENKSNGQQTAAPVKSVPPTSPSPVTGSNLGMKHPLARRL